MCACVCVRVCVLISLKSMRERDVEREKERHIPSLLSWHVNKHGSACLHSALASK